MSGDPNSALIAAIEKLSGFDRQMLEHRDALITNKVAVEALIAMVGALNLEIINLRSSIALINMAILTKLDPQHVLKLAKSIEQREADGAGFDNASEKFFAELARLAA